MLQKVEGALVAHGRPETSPELFDFIASLIRRHFTLILSIIGLWLALSALYLLTASSMYTADAQLVIDTHQGQVSSQQSNVGSADLSIDPGAVETQVEIIKSDNVSLSVIRDLHLNVDPEFVGQPGGMISSAISWIAGLIRPASMEIDDVAERKALIKFQKMEGIKRVGMTYVLDVSFTSVDPAKAARVANAIADAYVTDQLESKYQVTRRAGAWLQDRINEIRVQSADAERAVIDFKVKNNIVDSGGRLMNEQQMSEISSQLVQARAATAEAQARYDQIKELMKEDVPDGSVADSLKNDVIIKLRGQYVDLAAKEAIWAQKYGENHLATVGLRNQMREIRKSIVSELDRISNSYRSDLTIARTRQKSIEGSLDNLVADVQTKNKSGIQVRELESKAESSRTMYDTLLQRYMEAVQQQSFPISQSRLISPASRPLGRSSPKTVLVMGGGLFLGLMFAFGTAYMRDRNDSTFRTPRHVEDALALPCLTCVPRMILTGRGSEPAVNVDGTSSQNKRLITKPAFSYVVDRPLSSFSEALRSIKVSVDLKSGLERGRVIGFTSSVPNEGKSTIACNLAYLIANGGARVALIDADLRNPNLSRNVNPGREAEGLLTACKTGRPLSDYAVTDGVVGLNFIASGSALNELHTYESLSSKQMNDLVVQMKSHYDYIIVDLPPLHPVVDARGSVRFIDDYVFVIEWGRTSIELAERSLGNAPEIFDKSLGVVLNKSDAFQISRYDRAFTTSKYRQYYDRYGYEA